MRGGVGAALEELVEGELPVEGTDLDLVLASESGSHLVLSEELEGGCIERAGRPG